MGRDASGRPDAAPSLVPLAPPGPRPSGPARGGVHRRGRRADDGGRASGPAARRASTAARAAARAARAPRRARARVRFGGLGARARGPPRQLPGGRRARVRVARRDDARAARRLGPGRAGAGAGEDLARAARRRRARRRLPRREVHRVPPRARARPRRPAPLVLFRSPPARHGGDAAPARPRRDRAPRGRRRRARSRRAPRDEEPVLDRTHGSDFASFGLGRIEAIPAVAAAFGLPRRPSDLSAPTAPGPGFGSRGFFSGADAMASLADFLERGVEPPGAETGEAFERHVAASSRVASALDVGVLVRPGPLGHEVAVARHVRLAATRRSDAAAARAAAADAEAAAAEAAATRARRRAARGPPPPRLRPSASAPAREFIAECEKALGVERAAAGPWRPTRARLRAVVAEAARMKKRRKKTSSASRREKTREGDASGDESGEASGDAMNGDVPETLLAAATEYGMLHLGGGRFRAKAFEAEAERDDEREREEDRGARGEGEGEGEGEGLGSSSDSGSDSDSGSGSGSRTRTRGRTTPAARPTRRRPRRRVKKSAAASRPRPPPRPVLACSSTRRSARGLRGRVASRGRRGLGRRRRVRSRRRRVRSRRRAFPTRFLGSATWMRRTGAPSGGGARRWCTTTSFGRGPVGG